jgi:hypothetical protein
VDWGTTVGLAALTLVAVGAVALLALTIVFTRPDDVVQFASDHTAIVAGAGMITLTAGAVLGGVTAALRRG